ncbi:UDP-N-acetylmuramoyl-tripeptide--D-alanyl-D-alanine ligase [Bacillota bacterium LX-D]|nr:UDP-N-acetylmuramoyl-tripeptide--D-alanyl-D-alanine ligase [Bacillota bacterium LX-D]
MNLLFGKLEEIAQWIDGRLYGGDIKQEISNISTDTRTLEPGAIYFALQGESFDGHDFVQQAWTKGAVAVVVSKQELAGLANQKRCVIIVKDTLQALQSLARNHRLKYNIPVVAITGSNGKTTTKDLLASVLKVKLRVLKTEGNFNNEIGLPKTLLQLNEEHQAAVLEMGMRGLGQIASLCEIALPKAAIITNIGVTHMELLGSVENIAKAKGEILDFIEPQGFCFLNAEDQWSQSLKSRCRGRVYFYGFTEKADVRGVNIKNTAAGTEFTLQIEQQETEVKLPLPGEHNVLNALAAAGVGWQLGLTLEEIAAGLAKVQLSAMRLSFEPGLRGSMIINDTYNANPDSMKASLNILAEKSQKNIAVLGEMRELGCIAEEGHAAVGRHVAGLKIDYLLTVGSLGKYIAQGALMAGMAEERIKICQDTAEAKKCLADLLAPGYMALVKGSRALKMEEIVEYVINCDEVGKNGL